MIHWVYAWKSKARNISKITWFFSNMKYKFDYKAISQAGVSFLSILLHTPVMTLTSQKLTFSSL